MSNESPEPQDDCLPSAEAARKTVGLDAGLSEAWDGRKAVTRGAPTVVRTPAKAVRGEPGRRKAAERSKGSHPARKHRGGRGRRVGRGLVGARLLEMQLEEVLGGSEAPAIGAGVIVGGPPAAESMLDLRVPLELPPAIEALERFNVRHHLLALFLKHQIS